MSSASDVTMFRQIIAKYAVDSQAQSAWATTKPISTSDTITGSNIFAGGYVTATNGLRLPTTYMGTATLVAASTTVNVPACTTSSFVFITAKSIAGSQGILSAVAGTGSFVINSTQAGDRSVVQWMIVNPA